MSRGKNKKSVKSFAFQCLRLALVAYHTHLNGFCSFFLSIISRDMQNYRFTADFLHYFPVLTDGCLHIYFCVYYPRSNSLYFDIFEGFFMAESGFLGPAELAHSFVDAGVKKSRIPIFKMMLLGTLAGLYIGFAAHLATTVATGWTIGGTPALFGLKKFVIGCVFSVGLMLVIIPGSELFTGNNLMTVSLCHGRLGFGGLFRNWIPVYVSNLAGSVILAGIIAAGTGLLDSAVGATSIDIAIGKVSAAPQGIDHNVAYFFRGICCNFLVCIAVMMAIAAKYIAGKIWAIFFPIMAFVASGFEHCVANMYFIPAGIFAKNFDNAVLASKKGGAAILASDLAADASLTEKAAVAREALGSLNWASMWTHNLVSVTIGNIVGGAIFVGVVYYFLYVHGIEKE